MVLTKHLKNFQKCSLLLFILLMFCASQVGAQRFANDWIKPNQTYFKFKVLEEGIYRIDYFTFTTALTNAGISLSSLKADKIQIFRLGEEIPIFVEGEADGELNINDYIEFYGKGNDGKLDTRMFEIGKNGQLHDQYSLYTDTAVYFVTFLPDTSSLKGKRYLPYNNTTYTSTKYRSYVASSAHYDNSVYHYGTPYKLSAADMQHSEYTVAEGYRSAHFGYGNASNNRYLVHYNSQDYEPSGFSPTIEFTIIGSNDWRTATPDKNISVGLGKRLDLIQNKWDTLFEGFNVVNKKFILNSTELDTGLDLSITVNINASYAIQQVRYSHSELIFPAKFDLHNGTNKYFVLEPEFFSPRHISWDNYRTSYNAPIVYCLNNPIRILPEVLPTKQCRFMTPQNADFDTFYMADVNDIKYIGKIENVTLKRFDDHINRYNYLLVTSKVLQSSASEYATYRSNGFTPSLVFTEDLYNSFGFGYHHPLAIRNFCDFLLEKSDTFIPRFLTLLGKGYQTPDYRYDVFGQGDIVPAMGVPGSDNMFTSGLKGSNLWEPAMATGRISARNDNEVRDYLQKLREYESAGNQYWRKEVMHLSGGSDATQAARILGALSGLIPLVEDSTFGGKVITFSRSNKSLIDPEIRNSTIDNFKKGKNLITFIGHGSSSVFDLDVGAPTDYQNVGKYPVCYFNGCSTGNPFYPESSNDLPYGLEMMRLKRSGSIAFMAQTSLAEEGNVIAQVRTFYDEAFNTHYGEPLGDLIKYMIRRTQNANSNFLKSHSRQLLLQGDPAITLYAPDKPEYQILSQNITLEPSIVSALADSFILRIKIENLGSYTKDSATLIIKRLYPDKKTQREYKIVLPPIKYSYTLDYAIYSKDPSTAGENEFTVEINPYRVISEYGLRYDNNKVIKAMKIASNGVSLIYPERFGIVEGDSVEMVFQPLDLFTQNQQFKVQLDTSRNFDPNTSSAFIEKTFNEASLVKWKLKLPNYGYDSVAWYWRANVIIGGVQGGGYVERSFTNIQTHEPGWCQTEFPQLIQGSPTALRYDSMDRRFEFVALQKPIWIDMAFNPSAKGVKEGGFTSTDLNYGVGQNRAGFPEYDCPAQGIVLMLWDKFTLDRFLLPSVKPRCYWGSVYVPHNPSDQASSTRYQAYYTFDLGDPSQQNEFASLVDLIPAGTYVTGYSYQGMSPSAWTPAVRNTFNKLGCIKTDTIADDLTVYVFLGKKNGTKGSADEAYSIYDLSDPTTNYVQLKGTMSGTGSKGWLTSEKIGPVDSWGAVYHWFKTDELDPTIDNYFVDIYGVKKDGSDTLLRKEITASPFPINDINPSEYRFLYLKATFQDEVFNTAPQLKEWRVTYKPVPEGTVDPSKNFVFHADTLLEGDSFKFSINFTNISKLEFKDSLLVNYKLIKKEDQSQIDFGTRWFSPKLEVNGTKNFAYTISTKGMYGNYQFEFLVNKDYEQPEQLLINNSAIFNFYVAKDIVNPLLDVTFDGRHIINNEIVSPNPNILIVSKDENKLLLQDDTTTFTINLKYPNSSDFVNIPIASSSITFIPASDKNNLAQIEFNPKGLADGTYTLQVQSRDGSNNDAGKQFYEISFRVINEQSVTNFYPYPNPFSTSMRFVFTLTGAELPEDVRISVMTLSGKVVRQITKQELGNLRIGNNISDFVWDGTDQYGDRLANGVYLYKVEVTDANGKSMKEATFDDADKQNRDKYFKKNIGKIYIMR